MDFTFVSGNLGLDLAGTVSHRRNRRLDLLVTPADLARWTTAADLMTDEPPVSTDEFERAVALREAIYRLATAARVGEPFDSSDLELLNRAAEPAPPTIVLSQDGLSRTGTLANALSAAARATADLLGGPQLVLVRECEAELCTRLFVDTSRRRARRWCDMRKCGNRAKAATFRARHT